MINKDKWIWNEFQHVGADFSNIEEVENYDKKHGKFRDIAKENKDIMDKLNLPKGSKILDIGSGTGQLARFAARLGMNVTATDISKQMLDYSRKLSDEAGITNIDYVRQGFLSLEYPEESFDAVITSAALHHLPDLWKIVAIASIYNILAKGGQFILRDVVFHWDGQTLEEYMEAIVDSLPDEMKPRMETHINSEFSTVNWIMEGILTRTGFSIQQIDHLSPYFSVWHCFKTV